MTYAVLYRGQAECDLEYSSGSGMWGDDDNDDDFGLSFEEAKNMVLDYYRSKIARIEAMKEDDWEGWI